MQYFRASVENYEIWILRELLKTTYTRKMHVQAQKTSTSKVTPGQLPNDKQTGYAYMAVHIWINNTSYS